MNRKMLVLSLMLVLTLFFILASSALASGATAEFKLNVPIYLMHDNPYQMDVAPFVDENGRTMIPVRYLAMSLSVKEDYIFFRSEEQQVGFFRGNNLIVATVGDNMLVIADLINSINNYNDLLNFNEDNISKVSVIMMDTSPVIKDSRVFLPARYVAEALGYSTSFDAATKTVIISQ